MYSVVTQRTNMGKIIIVLTGVSMNAGTAYHIVVAGYNSTSDGDITLQWNYSSEIELPRNSFDRKNDKTVIKSTKGGLENQLKTDHNDRK